MCAAVRRTHLAIILVFFCHYSHFSKLTLEVEILHSVCLNPQLTDNLLCLNKPVFPHFVTFYIITLDILLLTYSLIYGKVYSLMNLW